MVPFSFLFSFNWDPKQSSITDLVHKHELKNRRSTFSVDVIVQLTISVWKLWKQVKHMKGSKEHLFIRTTTQSANFVGNPLCQAPKFHLNDSETVKKMMKNEMRSEITYLLCWAMLFSCPVFGKMFHIYVWHWMCRHRKQGPHLWRTCMLHHGPAFFFLSLIHIWRCRRR